MAEKPDPNPREVARTAELDAQEAVRKAVHDATHAKDGTPKAIVP